MDFKQLKKDSKALLISRKAEIRKDMLKIAGLYWIYAILFSALAFFILPKDIDNNELSYYIISYFINFIKSCANVILLVMAFHVLSRFISPNAASDPKITDIFKNQRIFWRCILLGIFQQIFLSANYIKNISRILGKDMGLSSKVFGLYLIIRLLAIIFSCLMMFIPYFIAQDITLKNSIKYTFKILKNLKYFIQLIFSLLPVGICILIVILAATLPIMYFKSYINLLYFNIAAEALSVAVENTILYALWMLYPYMYLCIIKYIESNRFCFQE